MLELNDEQQTTAENTDTNLQRTAAPSHDGSHAKQPSLLPTDRVEIFHQEVDDLPLVRHRERLRDLQLVAGRHQAEHRQQLARRCMNDGHHVQHCRPRRCQARPGRPRRCRARRCRARRCGGRLHGAERWVRRAAGRPRRCRARRCGGRLHGAERWVPRAAGRPPNWGGPSRLMPLLVNLFAEGARRRPGREAEVAGGARRRHLWQILGMRYWQDSCDLSLRSLVIHLREIGEIAER